MRIVCVGGGPAGLYFAISVKLREPGHEITVIERDPPGATYGWGVVYWDDLLDILYRNDPFSARALRAESVLWQDQRVILGSEQTAYLSGYGFSLGRARLLEILGERATELGIEVRYEHEVAVDEVGTVPELDGADLVLICDGAHSRLRQRHSEQFGSRLDVGGNPYIWLGTEKVFENFIFAFEQTEAGWIWFHAYPSTSGISTCIVECAQQTWQDLGFALLSNDDGVALLEKVFERDLDGHGLISQSRGEPARWQRFTEVSNKSWYHGNMVLAGDAAHTTHFSLGSGTRLAMIDAVELAQSLHTHPDLGAALADYDRRGRTALRHIQAGARASMEWFEEADRYLDRDAVSFAYEMAARHGAQPPWRQRMHQATQHPTIRATLRALNNRRRRRFARRRGEHANLPPARVPTNPM